MFTHYSLGLLALNYNQLIYFDTTLRTCYIEFYGTSIRNPYFLISFRVYFVSPQVCLQFSHSSVFKSPFVKAPRA